MPDYRRWYMPGGTFFFTLVTAGRARFLCDEVARSILHEVIVEARKRRPFEVLAAVLLPEHTHAIWRLLPGETDYSRRWGDIKSNFTRRWLAAGGVEQSVTAAKRAKGYRGVFQLRFIEHTIRGEGDFVDHVEYIHYNPVKHGLVRCPRDWAWSSFHRYVEAGFYPWNWGCADFAGPGPRVPKAKDQPLE